MKLLKATAAGAFAFFVVYLLGAFFSMSFDISTWYEGCRFFVAVVGGLVAIPAFGIAMEAM